MTKTIIATRYLLSAHLRNDGIWVEQKSSVVDDLAASFPIDQEVKVVGEPLVLLSPTKPTRVPLPPHSEFPRPLTCCDLSSTVYDELATSLGCILEENNTLPVFVDHCSRDESYASEVLNPLFHSTSMAYDLNFVGDNHPAFADTNEQFAKRIAAVYSSGDTIIVLGYRLQLVPRYLKLLDATKNAMIAFYFPSIFPSYETYLAAPESRGLLRGVLGADVVGFQTLEDQMNFLCCCTRILGVEVTNNDVIMPNDVCNTRCRVFFSPMGSDVSRLNRVVSEGESEIHLKKIRSTFKNRQVVLSVDSLLNTQGVPQKLAGFHEFLVQYPELGRNTVLIQVCLCGDVQAGDGACPTYVNAKEYHKTQGAVQKLLSEIHHCVGSINSEWGTLEHVPIHFLCLPADLRQLIPLYVVADVFACTSLKEAANPTINQFILCQSMNDVKNKAALVLSEFSGCSSLLKASCIIINPWNPRRTAEALYQALCMSQKERYSRFLYAYQQITNRCLVSWRHNLCDNLNDAQACRQRYRLGAHLPTATAVKFMLTATRRIFILSVPNCITDGHSYHTDPEHALPVRILNTLRILSMDPDTVLVMASSLSKGKLDLLIKKLPGAYYIAEGGSYIRCPNQSDYEDTSTYVSRFQKAEEGIVADAGVSDELEEYQIKECLDSLEDAFTFFGQRTPGAIVSRSETSLSFQYVDKFKEHAEDQALKLLSHIYEAHNLPPLVDVIVSHNGIRVRYSPWSLKRVMFFVIHDIFATQGWKSGVRCFSAIDLPVKDESIFNTIRNTVTELNRGQTVKFDPQSPVSISVSDQTLATKSQDMWKPQYECQANDVLRSESETMNSDDVGHRLLDLLEDTGSSVLDRNPWSLMSESLGPKDLYTTRKHIQFQKKKFFGEPRLSCTEDLGLKSPDVLCVGVGLKETWSDFCVVNPGTIQLTLNEIGRKISWLHRA
ncbi:MAG: uncharacterized protein KVP18_005046 [Porospora cf. gigantea A]|uniref:uncharacterized protein n=1 Tax=Porospora cf. gigantea A TaxID=2853593 RepID=UPI00355A144A|nr:MAG: hypothetical protein KVP18_005046 [Porospora cf. gigantea A]